MKKSSKIKKQQKIQTLREHWTSATWTTMISTKKMTTSWSPTISKSKTDSLMSLTSLILSQRKLLMISKSKIKYKMQFKLRCRWRRRRNRGRRKAIGWRRVCISKGLSNWRYRVRIRKRMKRSIRHRGRRLILESANSTRWEMNIRHPRSPCTTE